MIIAIRVGDRSFDVELGDLDARPIVATVDGREYLVWPDQAVSNTDVPAARESRRDMTSRPGRDGEAPRPPQPAGGPVRCRDGGARCVRAPIPGVVEAVSVRSGDQVVVGQDLLVLEAMKMKNVIRASRDGTIAAVLIAVGDHVAHRDPLVEYTE